VHESEGTLLRYIRPGAAFGVKESEFHVEA
jgi:hypothetical protein